MSVKYDKKATNIENHDIEDETWNDIKEIVK